MTSHDQPVSGARTSRRHFLHSASALAGAGAIGITNVEADARQTGQIERLPREVWIATISQNNMKADNHQQMTKALLRRMEETLPLGPDVICIPEVAPLANLSTDRPPLDAVAEVPVGEVSAPFAEFARNNHCNVVCPIYTKADGRYYNAAVFLDRQGKCRGEYRKMHPTIGEMDLGVAPGPSSPPVFDLDFGKVGAQICFDMQWPDGWLALERGGAEVVFWPSAFAGGLLVNDKARQHKYAVVSSTRKGTTKICDPTGQELSRTNHWDTWCCTAMNLERIVLHTWPYVQRFEEIRAKYGRRVRIETHAEEEYSVIESLSPEVRIADIMEEFELLTHRQHIDAADRRQKEG